MARLNVLGSRAASGTNIFANGGTGNGQTTRQEVHDKEIIGQEVNNQETFIPPDLCR